MFEILLLIFGLAYALRRPKLSRLTLDKFPGTDPERFAEWQSAQLRAIDLFLWATWGAFLFKVGLLFLVVSGGGLSAGAAGAFQVTIYLAWFGGLTTAAIYGSRAKKLQKAAGVRWP